jgi:hypothetical protein
MVLAFTRPQTLDSVRARLRAIEGNNPWQALARKSAAEITEPSVQPGAIVLTDDRAPVEEMTRRMLSK